MLAEVLDELAATLDEIRATIQQLDIRLREAFDSFRTGVAHRLYRLGYRLQGEEYEPPADWD
jgi:hypothetical protein